MLTPTRQEMLADLRAQISAGTLPAGGRVPSEAELCARYGLSRETVRKGLKDLQHEGLVVSFGGGLPRMVAHRQPLEVHVTARESVAWDNDMRRLGPVTPPRIRVAVEGNDVVRDVLRKVAGERHNWARWTFPANVAAGTDLARDEDIPQGSVAYLEELGWTVRQDVAVESRMSSEAESAALGYRGPVLIVDRTGKTAAGKLVFTSVQVFRADRTRLVLDL